MRVRRAVLVTVLLLLHFVFYAVESVAGWCQGPTRGVASWYGEKFDGKTMANGKPYDRHLYTCASRFYPLGTKLRVYFPRTNRTADVTVTDRGPWVKGRALDLSEQAAVRLGLKRYGIGTVYIVPYKENQ